MKKSLPSTTRSGVARRHWFWPIVCIVVIVGLVYVRLRPSARPAINVIDTTQTGPVQSQGMLYKETAIGQPGKYLFYDELGNLAQLDTAANLDTLVGRQVYLIGTIATTRSSTSRSILIPTSIIEIK